MIDFLFSPASTETHLIAPDKLPGSVSAYQQDLQTGVVELNFGDRSVYHLLFARGQLVNIYHHGEEIERLNSDAWFQSMQSERHSAHVRALALTPQAVRLVKILLEQERVDMQPLPQGVSLEQQFETWIKNPGPALAHIRWPNAEALALIPGQDAPPLYTLFISANQILHSAGGMQALYGWQEFPVLVSFLRSETHTRAWEEYLLYYSFSQMTTHLLERFSDLIGLMLVNTIIREINFTAAAHGWNISLSGTSVTDQMIFSSPTEAARVYSQLLETLFNQAEALLGADLLGGLVRESAQRLIAPCRTAMQEYNLIIPPG